MKQQFKNGVRLPVAFKAEVKVSGARVDHEVLPERQLRQSFAGTGHDILEGYGVNPKESEEKVSSHLPKAG